MTDPVRNRNDGEDFHLLWTARRALRLLDKRSGLVAVSIEGCSTSEGGSQTSDVELVVDTAEYYGNEAFLLADHVDYVQLKHSAVRTEDEWTVASLTKTVNQFAILFQKRCLDYGQEIAITKLGFVFVTNRPIHSEVTQALAAAQQDEGETDEETISTLARWKAKSGLNAAKFKCFLRLLRLQGRESNRAVQDDELRGGLATLSPRSTDEGFRDRLVEFVRRKTLTNAAHDPVIRQAALLKCLGVATPEDLFPAPPRFEEIPAPLLTQQEEQVAECVRRANAPVLVHGTSGVGKSVLARRLPSLMPPGSVAVVFDGFAGGDYRKPSQPRHLHEMGLVQIANELAENGLCEPLLPLEASRHKYLRAFRRRLKQAAITLRRHHADALVLVVLDAADNSEDAAKAHSEGPSFARDLAQEPPPPGCRLVLMARTERRNRFPDRAPKTIEIPLEPFSQAETAAHLRRSFPEAGAGSVVEFHRYTGGNPRVQSYLLARAGSLPELLRRQGPGDLSVDDQIGFDVQDALKQIREHSGDEAGIDRLCAALAILPPRVPTRILAAAANLEVATIDSFVADLGQPLLHLDGYVQFRDEPAETWFRDRFARGEADFVRMVESLHPLADQDAYVAAAWPSLLFQAGLHDCLFDHALGAEPDIEDVLERRAIVRERLRFGLRVAWKKGDHVTAACLLLRLGEAAATEEHQRDLLLKNDDLISALWSPEQVRETVFRKRAGGWYGVAHARYAAMLAPAPEHLAEARQSLRLAEEWLDEWAEFPSDEPNREGPDENDAAAFARAWLFLKGPEQCVDWIARWRPEVFRFRVAHRLAESLLDRGDNFRALALVESACYQDARIALGALLALTEAGQMPSAESVAAVIAAWSEIQPPDSEGYDFSSNKVTEEQGVVALAEAMARVGLNHEAILAHIERHLPKIPNYARTESYYFSNGHQDSLLCAYALRAVLKGEKFDPLILLPDRLKRDGDPLPHDSKVGEFKRVYGLLAPWYQLRAESLLGLHNIAEVKRLARTLAISGNSHFIPWQWRQDGAYWANYVAGLWWDVLLITNAANMEEVDAIETWLKQTAKWVYASTWTKLAWQSARANLPDLALRFATSARTILADDRDDASSEAEAWLSHARALLPICRDEAGVCFERGLAVLETRLGDESRYWLDVLSGIADSSGQTGNPQPEPAYRLARVAELVHQRYEHKFPWEDIALSLAHLCPTSALAIASRWADRRKADLSNILASLLPSMVSQKRLSVNQALSLGLLNDWNSGKLLNACLSREPNRNQRDFLLDIFVRELSLSAPNLPAAEKLREVADRHGLASPTLDQLLSRPPDPETRREREDFARYQRDPQEPLVLEGDFTRASDIDQAMESWRQNSRFHFRDDVVRQMAATVPANKRVQHLRAWLEVESLSAADILLALQDIADIWGNSGMAVAQETSRLIRKLTEDRAEELLASGYSFGFLLGRRGRQNRQALDFHLGTFVEAAAR